MGSIVSPVVASATRLGGSLSSAFRSTWTRLSGNPRGSSSNAVLAVAVVGVIVAVFLAEGMRATSYDLENAAVWVTRQNDLGRINTQVSQQDAGERMTELDEDMQVAQDGAFVAVGSAGQWTQVFVENLGTGEPVAMAPGVQVQAAGGTVAIHDTDSGHLRVGAADEFEAVASSFGADAESDAGADDDPPQDDEKSPAVDVGPDAWVEVNRNGRVGALSSDGTLVVVDRDGTERSRVELDIDPGAQLSFVGDEVVVLDGASMILPNGERVEVPGSGHQLQLPGDQADRVLVASDEALWSVPLEGGTATSLTGPEDVAATPGSARPVTISGCTYAAWTGSEPAVLHQCGDQLLVFELGEVAKDIQGNALTFRVNRDSVALNDMDSGTVLLIDEDGYVVAQDWEVLDEKDKDDEDEERSDEQLQQLDPEQDNVKPVAEDDSYGARPELPTIVTPLDNDSDANADPLTIELVDPEGVDGVELVQGSQALQITPPKDATEVTVDYVAFDGELRSDPARVTVKVFPFDGENRPPTLKKPGADLPELVVGANASTQYDVLSSFVDPEGDPIVLAGATPPDTAVAQVSVRPEGLLMYADRGGKAATSSVEVTVSDAPMSTDAAAATVSAKVPVEVTGPGQNSSPVARNDYLTTVVDQPVVIWPLANDVDPDGDDLSYQILDGGQRDSATIAENPDGSLSVTPSGETAVRLMYELTDGISPPVRAWIRVDVLREARAPSAALDLVVLPQPIEDGGAVQRTVDLLANDFSPSGAVLVASDVREKPGQRPVVRPTVQTLEHRRLRVSAAGVLATPVIYQYTLSDGVGTAQGTIVITSSASAENLLPLAIDDTVSVRAGDVVSIPVLSNDLDPEGGDLHLVAELERGAPSGRGLAFVAGQRVRFVAPDDPGSVELTYSVSDSTVGGVPDASRAVPGRIRVDVRSKGDNVSPRPPLVEARALTAQDVKITVPISGVDPDGDSVRLLGLASSAGLTAPRLGRIVDVGLDFFVYRPFDKVGTDTFRYAVVDSEGDEGVGTIRVGIAKSPGTNRAPTAADDRVIARPGTRLTYDPLTNDFDPEGGRIGFASEPIVNQSREGLASMDEGRLRISVPDEGVHTVVYRIVDPLELDDTATITIEVRDDAPGLAPVARDDLADPSIDATVVDVDVLENDSDPDGSVDDLRVEPVTDVGNRSAAELRVNGRRATVPVTPRSGIYPYRVTDEQDLSSHAVVRVPPRGEGVDQPPRLIRDVAPLRVEKNGNDLVPVAPQRLDAFVEDPEGAAVRFVDGSAVGVGVTAEVLGRDTFTVRSASIPAGEAAAAFLVTDGQGTDRGVTAAITIPVTVVNSTNQPPVWRSTAQVRLSQDRDERPTPIALAPLASDPDGDELAFEVVSAPAGVDAEVERGRLVVTATGDLQPGQQLDPIEVSVTDAEGLLAERNAAFGVEVVATTLPPPTVRSFAVEASAGRESAVNVLEGSFNPVPGTPLALVAAVPSGASDRIGRVSFDEDGRVALTPPEDSFGTTVVTFTVQDAFERTASNTVTFTVAAPPTPPPAPQVLQVDSRRVQVSWDSATANGKPVTGYQVRAESGAGCSSTSLSCVVTGLQPGTDYRFQVIATNDVGESDPSPWSATIRPDECPGVVPDVQLEFVREGNPTAGGRLVASWSAAPTDGTPVTGYEVRTVPASGTVALQPGASDRSVEILGLNNGEPYSVEVAALSACDRGRGEVGRSAQERPAGVPDAPTSVEARRTDDVVGGRVQVSWIEPGDGDPSDNGDEIIEYRVVEVNRRATVPPLQASAVTRSGNRASVEFAVDRIRDAYQFQVVAENRAGPSPSSSPSPPVAAGGKPGVVTQWAIEDRLPGTNTGFAGVRVQVTNPTQTGGLSIVRQQFSIPELFSGFRDIPADGYIRGLPIEGYSLTILFRVDNESGDEATRYSDPTAPIPIRPYGPVPTMQRVQWERLSATSGRFTWVPQLYSHGRAVVAFDYRINNGPWTRTTAWESPSYGSDYEQSFRIDVVAVDEEGQVGSTPISASGSTDTRPPPPPAPSVNIGWGGVTQACGGSTCQRVVGSMQNFAGNTTYTVSCQEGSGTQYHAYNITTNAAGSAGLPSNQCFHWGGGGGTWVVVGGVRSNTITRAW